MKAKVSLIIPVYNMEKYLEKCLDSVVKQNFKEFEAIVVNDGSTDSSQKIIDKYEKKYPKIIKAYEKKNGGLSDTRNYGIKKSNADYIMFLDSDDWIDENMVGDMYEKIEKGFDLVCCDTLEYYDDVSRNRTISCSLDSDILNVDEYKNIFINFYPIACNKIYKKSLFIDNDLWYKKGVWFEDVEMLYRLLPYIKSIGVVKKPFYNYYQRKGGISKSFDDRIANYIENMNGIIDFYKEKKIYNKYKEELEYSYVRYIYATMLGSAAKLANKRKDFGKYKKLLKLAIKNVKEKFPDYKKNKYLKFGLKGKYLKRFNYTLGLMLFWFIPKAKYK